jgi:prepilin-type N-terminal cleavage/methylation domain-containing protein
MSPRKKRRQRGFTLMELMIAMVILAVGLLGVAALMSQMAADSTQSRYMGTEALLASEKLEDLNRYPAIDPAVAAPGGTAGSLTSDVSQSVTVGAVTETVSYFDQVQISSGSGSMVETVAGTDSFGKLVYTTTTHTPDGKISITQSPTPPASPGDMLTFGRRWIIEQDVPVAGVRRITVLISLQNTASQAKFQTSMVRP